MKKLFMLLILALVVALAAPVMAEEVTQSFGQVTGTGSYIYVSTGYTPRYIETNTASPAQAVWQYGMAASACLKTVAMDASGSLTSYVAIATPCLKTYAGSTASPPGFMIGIDSDLFPVGSIIYWRTVR